MHNDEVQSKRPWGFYNRQSEFLEASADNYSSPDGKLELKPLNWPGHAERMPWMPPALLPMSSVPLTDENARMLEFRTRLLLRILNIQDGVAAAINRLTEKDQKPKEGLMRLSTALNDITLDLCKTASSLLINIVCLRRDAFLAKSILTVDQATGLRYDDFTQSTDLFSPEALNRIDSN